MNVENYGYWWAVQFSFDKDPLCYVYDVDNIFDKIEEFRFQSIDNYYNRVCYVVLLNNSKVQTLITLRFPDLIKRFSNSERKRIKKKKC